MKLYRDVRFILRWRTGTRILLALLQALVTASCTTSGLEAELCPGLAPAPSRPYGKWLSAGQRQGVDILPGITLLTGVDLRPGQTRFCVPELADPYVTQLQNSAIISGTAQYYMKFQSLQAIQERKPYEIVWNDYYYSDGTPMEGNRYFANSWDLKPTLWSSSSKPNPRLWDPAQDTAPPIMVWYGGHMRPSSGAKTSRWPDDNYSRDVFAFIEKEPGKWVSMEDSIFSPRGGWPRPAGNYLGHRYGHQIVSIDHVPQVYYEEVTAVKADGSPAVTEIFMDEMASPFLTRGSPTKLISPFDAVTGKPFPSAIREDGSLLVEGPLYFRFLFEGDEWEALGFSAGSYYANYPAAFASRRVSEGLRGEPFQIDLKDDGSDLHDAGAELRQLLNSVGGPGRPSVIVGPDGVAIPDAAGNIQLLAHAYRKDTQGFRVTLQASLIIKRGPRGALRFQIAAPEMQRALFL